MPWGASTGVGLAAGLAGVGFGEIPGGTLHPALLRLERQGLVWAPRVPSTLGPVRKYHELTPLGAEDASRRRRTGPLRGDVDAGSKEPSR